MSAKLEIIGLASKKTLFLGNLKEFSQEESLMDFLRKLGLPIASSCFGEGVCKKCVVQNNGKEIISCQIKKAQMTEENNLITIQYL